MDNNRNYVESKDIWDAESSKSFVKAKTDWFNMDKYSSRLHLSFVLHNGQKPKPKQLDAIEIGIPMVKAGSDGARGTGITALYLADAITSNLLSYMKDAAIQKAQQTNSAYAEDIFACIGGTTANRAKDGKPEFRKFSIAPGKVAGTYVLKASRCEGEESQTGGVQPKKGAQFTQIIVPVSEAYMRTLAETIRSEWTAFLTARRMQQMMGQGNQTITQPYQEEPRNYAPVPAMAPAPVSMPAPAPAPVSAIQTPIRVCIAYDQTQTINGGLPYAIMGADKAVKIIRGAISKIQQKTNMAANPESCNAVKKLIKSGEKGKCLILFQDRNNPARTGVLVVVCDDLLQ